MIKSRLTAKAQTTIPVAVRAALRLRPGDELAYRIEPDGHRVVLARAEPATASGDDPFAVFAEWDGPEDTRAYAKL